VVWVGAVLCLNLHHQEIKEVQVIVTLIREEIVVVVEEEAAVEQVLRLLQVHLMD